MYFVGITYSIDGQTSLFPCENEEMAARTFNSLLNPEIHKLVRVSDTLVYRSYNDGTTTRRDTVFIGECKEDIRRICAIQRNTTDMEMLRRRRLKTNYEG